MVDGNYFFKGLIILALVAPGLNVWADFAGGVAAYKQRDYARAQVLFGALAEAGDARAQFALGLLYDNGEGLAQDDQRALEWYRASAAQGYAKAQYNLALMLENGRAGKRGPCGSRLVRACGPARQCRCRNPTAWLC